MIFFYFSSIVDPINGQVQPPVTVDSNVIIGNSNHSSGSSSSSSSASTSGDHKMVPAAIGSERKRHLPILTPVGSIPIGVTSDWSSVLKR